MSDQPLADAPPGDWRVEVETWSHYEPGTPFGVYQKEERKIVIYKGDVTAFAVPWSGGAEAAVRSLVADAERWRQAERDRYLRSEGWSHP